MISLKIWLKLKTLLDLPLCFILQSLKKSSPAHKIMKLF